MNNFNYHLLTFDVEHWYEGYRYRNLDGWENVSPRDHIIVERLFDLLGKYDQKATFFFTGRFAREFPRLVKQCVDFGHEVASHSDQHCVIYRMKGDVEFRRDLRASLDTLSDITGRAVLGYRAPKWSLTVDNQYWVFEALAEAGLIYDSSFFPTLGSEKFRREGKPLRINLPNNHSLIEIPASGYRIGPLTIPVAGGLYFRTFPAWAVFAMLAQKKIDGGYGMLYVHPYDLDDSNLSVKSGGLFFKFFRSYGVAGAWKKLEHIISEHRFTSIEKSLPFLPIEAKLDLRRAV